RSLTISLLGDIRSNQMRARLYLSEPSRDDPSFDLVRRAFLGIRTTRLSQGPVDGDWQASVESVTPVGEPQRVERAVVVSFPLTVAYLHDVRQHIGSDITIVFPDGHFISTLPDTDAAALWGRLPVDIGPGDETDPFVFSTELGGRPNKTRVGAFEIGTRREGALLLTMPMDDLLATRRAILGGGLGITAVVILVATILYVSLIRRITGPLERLSLATHDIAAGRLDIQVPVTTNDEVGELARAFNVMIRRLRESRREIEEWNRELGRRVEERTRSLEQARAELEAVNEQLVYALRRLRETQDSMVQTEKLAAVGQLASTIAHEIRNPLAGIRGALELILPQLEDPAHKQVLEQIVEEVDRINRTTSRLLGFARPAEPHREWTSLAALIDNVCFLVGQQARRQGVEIRRDYEPPDRPLYLDPQLTTQAFLNIVLNALQAIEGKGTLTIRSRWLSDDATVQIEFEDTGSGIPPEIQEKLFTPFFTTKRQGTGLGLHVVKSIIERQGGRVSLRSTVGKGTVFIVRLPVQERAETEEAG
ncbi:MAG: HAMP domain-containing protein, partial [Deltaproteobacteria bacterium]